MKSFFKNSVLTLLVGLARLRVRRLRPVIVGITGSVGKTSAKDALFTILKQHYKVLRSEKSFNTEFGLPLAILEQPSGFSNPLDWGKTILRALKKTVLGGENYEILVLEMGVDKPGDMDFLLKIVQPQIGIITAIKPVHLGEAHFKNIDEIFAEKTKLVKNLPKEATAILNYDDPMLVTLAKELQCKILTYGQNPQADLRVENLKSSHDGISFDLIYKNQAATARFNLPGKYQIYILLPAIAAAITLGIGLEDAVKGLEDYQLPPGRMSLIRGIKESVILDSSYNASPETMKTALELLNELGGKRRIAVLGAMNELGADSKKFHFEVGEFVPGKAEILVAVGEEAKEFAAGAKINGMEKKNIHCFKAAEEAAKFMLENIEAGDLILVKGSQNNVRLEKLVKTLMDDPALAEKLLVRQDKHWQSN